MKAKDLSEILDQNPQKLLCITEEGSKHQKLLLQFISLLLAVFLNKSEVHIYYYYRFSSPGSACVYTAYL